MERKKLMEASITKEINEINPIVAIPYASSVYSLALTKGPKWLFTGGEDGLIRKFDFFQSVEGKSLLTVSQRHQLIDSILFNGMICSYWENEIPFYKTDLSNIKNAQSNSQKKKTSSSSSSSTTADSNSFFEPQISPVYSLCTDYDGFWLLSGLQNGSITLQSIRSSEGTIQWYFKNANDKNIDSNNKMYHHSNTVSCLITNSLQTNFLSGSWDRKILQWDLNTGKNMNVFNKSTGQISSLEYRPIIGTDLNWQPKDDENDEKNKKNEDENDDSDMGSLFDDDDDDDKDENNDNDSNEDKSKLTKDETGDIEMKDVDNDQPKEMVASENPQVKRDITKLQRESLQSGTYEGAQTSDNIFLSSSIDGSINVWDSRITYKSNCVEKFPVLAHTPPWCMSATWSADGDSIFVGRRNSTIEEYDIRYPTKVSKLMKFPAASGSISVVRTLPNRNYILCGCQDNIRLYDLRLYESGNTFKKNSSSKIPFTIIPGHNGGILSDMYVDPTCRFMISASGNRGWQGKAADYVYIYEFL